MRIFPSSLLTVALAAAAAGASAQSVGDEIVIPAGDFAKDYTGIVVEAGGTGGTGVERGAFRFPQTADAVVVGISTRLPAGWVGHEIEVVFGGSAAQAVGTTFPIEGIVDNTAFGLTALLRSENLGTTQVTVLTGHLLTQRRFGIAIGRSGAANLTAVTAVTMNFEYLILRLTS